MKMKMFSADELRDFLQAEIAAGRKICAPTFDELATVMVAASLLSVACRRGYALRLSADRARIEFDMNAPTWFTLAILAHYEDVLEHMQGDFLAAWADRNRRAERFGEPHPRGDSDDDF